MGRAYVSVPDGLLELTRIKEDSGLIARDLAALRIEMQATR